MQTFERMMRMRFIPLFLSLIAALLVLGAGATGTQPSASDAAKGKKKRDRPVDLDRSPHLWATINVCDTEAHPNTIGIRGSMPGLGNRRTTLRMRFQVQYKAKLDGKWHNADESADSGWKTVGRTKRQVVESGQNFTFVPPADGGAHHLRGSVRFKWLYRGKLWAYKRRFSEVGHLATAGSDPVGYSAAICEIRQP